MSDLTTIIDNSGVPINASNGALHVAQSDPNDSSRQGEFDNKVKAPIGITLEHHKTHEKASYEAHINSANLAVASLNVAFKTLAGSKLAHMLIGFSNNDEVLFEIIKGASWTQGTGTAITVFNREQDDGGASVLMLENKNQAAFAASNQVIKDVSGISGGTVIVPIYTYNAGLGAAVIAESRSSAQERILKNDETYIFRMTQTDGNCKMSLDLNWYEHTNQ